MFHTTNKVKEIITDTKAFCNIKALRGLWNYRWGIWNPRFLLLWSFLLLKGFINKTQRFSHIKKPTCSPTRPSLTPLSNSYNLQKKCLTSCFILQYVPLCTQKVTSPKGAHYAKSEQLCSSRCGQRLSVRVSRKIPHMVLL